MVCMDETHEQKHGRMKRFRVNSKCDAMRYHEMRIQNEMSCTTCMKWTREWIDLMDSWMKQRTKEQSHELTKRLTIQESSCTIKLPSVIVTWKDFCLLTGLSGLAQAVFLGARGPVRENISCHASPGWSFLSLAVSDRHLFSEPKCCQLLPRTVGRPW